MKKGFFGSRNDHQWNRYTALRVLLAVGSLISMVLASGADSYWR